MRGKEENKAAILWFELQDPVDYYTAFEKAKVFWPAIAKFPRFSWNDTNLHVNDKGAIIVPGNTLRAWRTSIKSWLVLHFKSVCASG
jgi:hypothetical protein